MSLPLVRKAGNFLKLLLNTTKDQVRALFYTLTPLQTAALCEILFNLQKLPLASRIVKELRKRKFLINKLTDNKLSTRKKLALLQTHYRQVQLTLELVKKDLLSLLE